MTQVENSGTHMNAHTTEEQSKKDIIGYVAIWIILLMALVLSLILGEFGKSNGLLAAIFIIAFIKAGLVIHFFMKLTLEPWFIKLALASCFLVLGSFFFGIYPDVTINNAAIVRPDVFEIDVPLHDGDIENGKKVYSVTCISCHQADGSGLSAGVAVAANFIKEAYRLEQSDEVLMKHAYEGYNSDAMPAQMPPQKTTRSKQEVLDAIAYIRATFGSRDGEKDDQKKGGK